MIISRDTGMLNDYFSITKGQLIDLNHFCTLGAMENDTEETFAVMDSKGKIKYVPKKDVKKYKSGMLSMDEVIDKELMIKELV